MKYNVKYASDEEENENVNENRLGREDLFSYPFEMYPCGWERERERKAESDHAREETCEGE